MCVFKNQDRFGSSSPGLWVWRRWESAISPDFMVHPNWNAFLQVQKYINWGVFWANEREQNQSLVQAWKKSNHGLSCERDVLVKSVYSPTQPTTFTTTTGRRLRPPPPPSSSRPSRLPSSSWSSPTASTSTLCWRFRGSTFHRSRPSSIQSAPTHTLTLSSTYVRTISICSRDKDGGKMTCLPFIHHTKSEAISQCQMDKSLFLACKWCGKEWT